MCCHTAVSLATLKNDVSLSSIFFLRLKWESFPKREEAPLCVQRRGSVPKCVKGSSAGLASCRWDVPQPCAPPSAQRPSWHVMEAHKGKNSTGWAVSLFIICHIVPPLCCMYEIYKTPDRSETTAGAGHNGGEWRLNCGCNLEFLCLCGYQGDASSLWGGPLWTQLKTRGRVRKQRRSVEERATVTQRCPWGSGKRSRVFTA